MWKLLPVCLLVSCAAVDQQRSDSDEDPSESARVVRQLQLSLGKPSPGAGDQPLRRNFQAQGVQGWLDETGAWNTKVEVHHRRLRCGVYETGIQLGSGSPACSNVAWLTGIEYSTRLRHCNSASRVHAGSGTFSDAVDRPEAVNCVRVVVRCEGTC